MPKPHLVHVSNFTTSLQWWCHIAVMSVNPFYPIFFFLLSDVGIFTHDHFAQYCTKPIWIVMEITSISSYSITLTSEYLIIKITPVINHFISFRKKREIHNSSHRIRLFCWLHVDVIKQRKNTCLRQVDTTSGAYCKKQYAMTKHLARRCNKLGQNKKPKSGVIRWQVLFLYLF